LDFAKVLGFLFITAWNLGFWILVIRVTGFYRKVSVVQRSLGLEVKQTSLTVESFNAARNYVKKVDSDYKKIMEVSDD
jgi:hypothetical protein